MKSKPSIPLYLETDAKYHSLRQLQVIICYNIIIDFCVNFIEISYYCDSDEILFPKLSCRELDEVTPHWSFHFTADSHCFAVRNWYISKSSML